MDKISVVIITLNEERNIARCLKSVRILADEVIVVDSLSNDATKQIAESLGAKVIEQAFLGHIEQKNFAKNQASNDWILSLDADESLSIELQESILAENGSDIVDGILILSSVCFKRMMVSGRV